VKCSLRIPPCVKKERVRDITTVTTTTKQFIEKNFYMDVVEPGIVWVD
jgi:hypothetical protein